MRRALTSGLALVLLMGLALPATAGSRTTGDQLSLLFGCPDSNYPADTAFHVLHGNGFNPTEGTESNFGEWLFRLEVDGILLPLSHVRITEVDHSVPNGIFLSKRFAYNFPEGLTAGTHNLTGIWSDPSGAVTWVEDCDIEFS